MSRSKYACDTLRHRADTKAQVFHVALVSDEDGSSTASRINCIISVEGSNGTAVAAKCGEERAGDALSAPMEDSVSLILPQGICGYARGVSYRGNTKRL